jgi:hypothetical protein
MLPGGLLMLFALVLLVAFYGRFARQMGAFLGGVGFGTFIDELGKFVTRDNDYFYRPTIALIYIVFVLTYLLIRHLSQTSQASPEVYLVNALQEMENVVVADLDPAERERALEFLAHADPASPLTRAMRRMLRRSDLVEPAPPNRFAQLRRAASRHYTRLAERPGFARAVAIFFAAQLVIMLMHGLALLLRSQLTVPLISGLPPLSRLEAGFSWIDYLQLATGAFSAVLILSGIGRILLGQRVRALRLFRYAVIASVVLIQPFMFYYHQWFALAMLVYNLLLLRALNYAINHEAA